MKPSFYFYKSEIYSLSYNQIFLNSKYNSSILLSLI